jgi:hypothetical protein
MSISKLIKTGSVLSLKSDFKIFGIKIYDRQEFCVALVMGSKCFLIREFDEGIFMQPVDFSYLNSKYSVEVYNPDFNISCDYLTKRILNNIGDYGLIKKLDICKYIGWLYDYPKWNDLNKRNLLDKLNFLKKQ